jgi:hypothetical protein
VTEPREGPCPPEEFGSIEDRKLFWRSSAWGLLLLAVSGFITAPLVLLLYPPAGRDLWFAFAMGETALLVAVGACWSKVKGRSPAWGFLCLGGPFGLLAIAFLGRLCVRCGRPGGARSETCASCGGPF